MNDEITVVYGFESAEQTKSERDNAAALKPRNADSGQRAEVFG